MKVLIKTLQQDTFTIDAQPTETVLNLKEKIQGVKSHPVQSQKLIYSGKILADSTTLESCEFKEKDFIVLMTQKPKAAAASSSTAAPAKPAAAPAAPAPPVTQASAPVAVPAAAPTPPTPTPAAAVAATPAAPATPRAFGESSSLLAGTELQTMIQNLVDMGFPRQEVIIALRASYNNPDRAVEYLTDGIPQHLRQEATAAAAPAAPARTAAPPAAAPPVAQTQPARPAAPAQPGAPENLFLAAQQQRQQQAAGGPAGFGAPGALGRAAGGRDQMEADLLEIAQSDPAALPGLIQRLQASHPELATVPPEQLIAMLNMLRQAGGDDDLGMEGDPQTTTIQLTTEEHDAVRRLVDLGFEEQDALAAYISCDKNFEIAANLLFQQREEEMQD